jgi:hypothetical protein
VPASAAYAAIADLDRMAARSPEFTGAWPRPRLPLTAGTRFVGWNRSGWRRWPTTCRVEAAEPPRSLVLAVDVVGLPIARWSYLIEPLTSGSCRVTQAWEDRRGGGPAGSLARWLGQVATGTDVEERVARNRAAVAASLDGLARELAVTP